MALTDDLLAALPVGSTIERTATGYDIKKRAGNGIQHGVGASIAAALADIGSLHPDAKDKDKK